MEVMVEIVVSTVERILVGAIVTVVLSVQPISLTYALGRLEGVSGVAWAEASLDTIDISVGVFREEVTDAPTCLS